MTSELADKVAIVTGAGRNIGRAIALALADAGASIVVNARTRRDEVEAVAREIGSAGGRAVVHMGDVADAEAMQAMADAALGGFGRIDILVNNAALRREKAFADMNYSDWREILDVTLNGAFHCTKACLAALRKSGAGTIINIGGLSAHTGAKQRAHVVTAKAGIVGLTRALASELATDGITVNCVVPGLIGTPRPSGQPEPAHHSTHGTLTGKRASLRMSPPPCAFSAARQRGTSRARPSMLMAGPTLARNAWLTPAMPEKCPRLAHCLVVTIFPP